jgi:AraC-like DNA-binding protein
VDRIAESGGRVSVTELATQTGYTRKHLATLFERQVGMTPKALCRVHRFRGTLTVLDGATQSPWAALAEQRGYYDQSHLINEFRSFAGFSPAELLKQSRPHPQSVVVR